MDDKVLYMVGKGKFFHTKAIVMNGVDESLANTTNQSIGTGNTWTVNSWLSTTVTQAQGTRQVLVLRGLPGINDGLFMSVDAPSFGNVSLGIVLYNTGGGLFKNWTSSATFATGANAMLTVTWNGTDLKLYTNAIEDATPTKTVDNAGTMADSNRSMYAGSNALGGARFPGALSRIDLWSSVLAANEITSLYDSGNGFRLDTREAFGNYTSTANLEHQQLCGKEAPETGTTDFVSSDAINLYANDLNIASENIRSFQA